MGRGPPVSVSDGSPGARGLVGAAGARIGFAGRLGGGEHRGARWSGDRRRQQRHRRGKELLAAGGARMTGVTRDDGRDDLKSQYASINLVEDRAKSPCRR